MAQLPAIKRFATEDFPEQTSWIGKLFYPLNLLLQTNYSALANGITLKDNCMAQLATLPVTGASPTTSFPYKYSPQMPIGVVVANVIQTNVPAVALTSAVGCLWTITSGIVTVTVQGLDSGSTYNVTFITWGG